MANLFDEDNDRKLLKKEWKLGWTTKVAVS